MAYIRKTDKYIRPYVKKTIKRPIAECHAMDKYYTQPTSADLCASLLLEDVKASGLVDPVFLEPSAGAGGLVDALVRLGVDRANIIALDLHPDRADIVEADFLAPETVERIKTAANGRPLVGFMNPPYGSNCKEALRFLSHALELCDIVGTIMPIPFARYNVQKHAPEGAKVVHGERLDPRESFRVKNSLYLVYTIYQTWHKLDTLPNERIYALEATNHPDYAARIHKFETAEEITNDDSWDIAILYKFSKNSGSSWAAVAHADREKLSPNIKYNLIKVHKPETFDRIMDIDWNKHRHHFHISPTVSPTVVYDVYSKQYGA